MKSISFMRIIVVFLSPNRSVTFVTRHWNSCCCWELNPTFHVCLLSTSLLSLRAFFFTQFGWNTAQNTTPADEVGLRGQVEATGSVDEVLKKFSHLVLLRRQPSFIRENKRDWSPDLCCCCLCDYCLEISVLLISDSAVSGREVWEIKCHLMSLKF